MPESIENVAATRNAALDGFDHADGRITSPGKFEGEAVYVPYFWGLGLEGMADRYNGTVYGFNLTAGDKEVWPELKRRRTLKLAEDSVGFVREI